MNKVKEKNYINSTYTKITHTPNNVRFHLSTSQNYKPQNYTSFLHMLYGMQTGRLLKPDGLDRSCIILKRGEA
jgi:hypothetical protein